MATSFIGQDTLPMGLRNNNPGNLRPNPNFKWDGEITPVGSPYCQFIDVEHGIRAMSKDLHTKIAIDGLNTIDKYIPKYAPPSDNNFTQSYINTVSEVSGIAPTTILIPNEPTLLLLIPAHIRVEVGVPDYELITNEMIQTGVSMAFN